MLVLGEDSALLPPSSLLGLAPVSASSAAFFRLGDWNCRKRFFCGVWYSSVGSDLLGFVLGGVDAGGALVGVCPDISVIATAAIRRALTAVFSAVLGSESTEDSCDWVVSFSPFWSDGDCDSSGVRDGMEPMSPDS